MDYKEAEKMLGGKSEVYLHLSPPVRMEGPDYYGGPITIKLYSTSILTILMDNSITIRTDEVRTKTTKKYINKYLPKDWQVYQEKEIWYLRHIMYEGQEDVSPVYLFSDGITICSDNWTVIGDNFPILSEKR